MRRCFAGKVVADKVSLTLFGAGFYGRDKSYLIPRAYVFAGFNPGTGIIPMRNLLGLIGRFRSDRRGNIAVIFTLAMIPLVSALGSAVDYSMATRMKAKLQSAADAASVSSISQNSAGYLAATQMSSDGTIAAGVTEANLIFDGNMSTIAGYQNLTRTSTVTKTGVNLNSNITFSAQVPTTFMRVIGMQALTVSGSSKSAAKLPPYLDFYLTLDVSGSMGLPSTTAEAQRMQAVNPDNFVQYPTGCTLACHFAPQKSACLDDPNVTSPTNYPANPPTNSNYTQRYSTNNYCMGYAYSRVSQAALKNLINMLPTATSPATPKQVPGLPKQMLSGLPASLNTDPKFGLPAVTSCPTAGSDACIQLRLDAVGFALNATKAANGFSGLFETAQTKELVTNQFRIGIYPFITDIDKNYSPLTTTINGSNQTPGTINYAAANLATELDTNLNSTLGSGGTHIDNALHSINNLITSVGTGTSATNTQPYVFLVTDGAQDNQYKDVPNGSWHGSNHATVLNDSTVTYPTACADLKARGIIVSVLNIPYQTINPVNTTFAGNEDTYANNNITSIPKPLQDCASPPDAGGTYYYEATSPTEIQNSLNAMFNHAMVTAHITN
jgi:Flp pilus assembly protein TadG